MLGKHGFAHFLPNHCLLQDCKDLSFRRKDLLSDLPLSGLLNPWPVAMGTLTEGTLIHNNMVCIIYQVDSPPF